MKALALLLLLSCARAPRPPPAKGELIQARVHSDALAQNLLGDPAELRVLVWLPPGYAASARRYPVLYWLHGFGGAPESLVNGPLQAAAPELIVVAPSGANGYGGSLWVDSKVTGGWAQALDRDVVGWVDRTFRTLPRSDARGIAGHSMGGAAALQHALAHPEIFSAAYALSPCCLRDQLAQDLPAEAGAGIRTRDDLRRARPLDQLAVAFGAALAGDPSRPPLFVDVASRERWTVPLAIANAPKLRVIGLDFGTGDEFRHIPATVRAVYDELQAAGAAVQLQEYDGGHSDRLGERLSARVLPFFAYALSSRQ